MLPKLLHEAQALLRHLLALARLHELEIFLKAIEMQLYTSVNSVLAALLVDAAEHKATANADATQTLQAICVLNDTESRHHRHALLDLLGLRHLAGEGDARSDVRDMGIDTRVDAGVRLEKVADDVFLVSVVALLADVVFGVADVMNHAREVHDGLVDVLSPVVVLVLFVDLEGHRYHALDVLVVVRCVECRAVHVPDDCHVDLHEHLAVLWVDAKLLWIDGLVRAPVQGVIGVATGQSGAGGDRAIF